jgi:hypothetical protein
MEDGIALIVAIKLVPQPRHIQKCNSIKRIMEDKLCLVISSKDGTQIIVALPATMMLRRGLNLVMWRLRERPCLFVIRVGSG